MPRSPRNDIANGLHHVTQRGLERRAIVIDDDDRSHWWRLFERVARRCRWRVYAVVLLDNHFHIFFRAVDPNLSEGMHDLDSGYASLFNARHHREGPLFQGRFKSKPVESDSHAWELSRYVHLNPYRAGLTRDPFQYRWSSCQFYLNSQRAPDWLDWKTVFAEYGKIEGAARIAYKRFIDAGMKDPPPNPLREFETEVPDIPVNHEAELPPTQKDGITLDTIIETVCVAFDESPQRLMVPGRHGHLARDAAVLIARELLGESLDHLASRFGGVSRSSISEIVKRARLREQEVQQFHLQIEAIRNKLR